jgi:hypothetical protein
MLNESQIPAPRVPITGVEGGLVTREWFRFFNYVYETLLQLSAATTAIYGAFRDNTSTAWAANTPSLIPLGITDYISGLTHGSSRVNIQTAGLYTITASFQLTNPNNANDDDLSVWLRVNSVDAPATTSRVTVVKEHSGTPGSNLLTVNFFYLFAAGDYFELYGISKLGYAQIVTYPASTSPAYPEAPGTILTVARIK